MEANAVFGLIQLMAFVLGTCNGFELIDVDEYLRMYGYMQDRMPGTRISASEENRQLGLKRFQNFVELEVTGEFDSSTREMMEKPRCGCNDLIMPEKKFMVRTRRDLTQFKPVEFVAGPNTWKKNQLTYSFLRRNTITNKLDDRVIRAEIDRAFKVWTDVSALDIRYISDPNAADIVVSFESGDHRDGSAFDGPSRVLAHAFYPETGVAHFDNDESWVSNTSGIDVFTVAAHEFGHAFGLAHSGNQEALMAPFYAGYQANYKLHSDDIRGIQSLYGAGNNNNQPPIYTTLPPVTSRPPTTRRPLPPRTTPRTSPTTPDTTPDYCKFQFKGVMRDDNGDIMAFNGKGDVMKMTFTGGMYDIVKMADIFPDGPSNFDDVMNVPSAGTVFFRRVIQWKYQTKPGTISERQLVTRKYIPNARRMVRERIRAVVARSHNQAFVIGTYFVTEFSAQTMELATGSTNYVSTVFPGIPSRVDAALAMNARDMYFFKGSQYWRFDYYTKRVAGPRKIAPRFIRRSCL